MKSLGIILTILLLAFTLTACQSISNTYYDTKDVLDYVNRPAENLYYPEAEEEAYCESQAKELVPPIVALVHTKKSDQWYIAKASWRDGSYFDFKTYQFRSGSQEGESPNLLYPSKVLADNYFQDLHERAKKLGIKLEKGVDNE